jgi:hypothetical protein
MTLSIRTAASVGAIAALFFGLCLFPARAASHSAQPRGQGYDRSSQARDVGPETQIFVGVVIRVPETNSPPPQTFMIYDDMHRATFFLNDPEDTARFEGERTKVVGVLEQGDTATIRVESIDLYRPLIYLRVGK